VGVVVGAIVWGAVAVAVVGIEVLGLVVMSGIAEAILAVLVGGLFLCVRWRRGEAVVVGW
jgi:hypothetical protein